MLKNTSGLHLMQGPITVFEGSNYAGDAHILDMEPNEHRLISYAIDLGTEVETAPSFNEGRVVAVKALKGFVKTTTRIRESKYYTITNRNDVAHVVLIEHPVRNDYHLVERATPVETTRDYYRFVHAVASSKIATHTVTEERILEVSFNLANTSDEEMRFFMAQKAITPECKAGLQKAIELRAAMTKTQGKIAEQERQLKTIVEDQTRLRQPERDAGHGGGLQALSQEVRRPGNAARGLPGQDQKAPGRRVHPEEGARGLPGQFLRRVGELFVVILP